MRFITFMSMGRKLIATLTGADRNWFYAHSICRSRDGAFVTANAKISRNIAHEIIDTDYPGYVRKQPQLRAEWWYEHPQGETKVNRRALRPEQENSASRYWRWMLDMERKYRGDTP